MKGKLKAKTNNIDAKLKQRGPATEKVGKRPSSAIIHDNKSVSAVRKATGGARWKWMSDAAMDAVYYILGTLAPCGQDWIKVRYDYLKQYDDNIKALEQKITTLEEREIDVLESIQAAKRNGEQIRNSVQKWITNVDGVKMEARKFLEDNVNMNKRCFAVWNIITLYRISREAERKHQAVGRLCEEQAQFGTNVSLPTPPPEIDSIFSKDFVPFQTTKLAMEKVMDALKEDSTNFVGIHGMGGVGKTTLVQEIGRKCKEEMLFDKVVMAVVSQAANIETIQKKIAEFLGLQLEEKNEIVRASRLNNRLKSENKVLVILDDVWAKLDLRTIGIPSGEDHKGCKVVVTTRRRQVCTTMGSSLQATKIVRLDVLTEQESWHLFKLQAGDIIELARIRIVAHKVLKECGGLPIALVTVGSAMRGKDVEEWEEAALELEKSNPANIEDMDEKVFKCIKFSYDYLRDEEAKACFLLCCLFPEDSEIKTETLVRYGVGLNTFKGINKIQEARRRANFIITSLKASSLLLASEYEGCVKMHDVVRDVAKRIASDRYFVKAGEGLKEWPNELSIDGYSGIGISLMENDIRKYPDALECPNLEIFLMRHNNVEQEMPVEVFKGMKMLRVLDQSYNKYGNRRLEPSFSHLTNLRTLIIDGIYKSFSIWGISALGEMKMLQAVSLSSCIFEEPLDALRKMKNLRLLDLTASENCSSLFNFAEDCNFPQLEELYLSEGMSCSIAELMKCCPRLKVLKFRFNDIIQIPDNFDFSHLDHFDISVGIDPYVRGYIENRLSVNGTSGGLDDDVALLVRIGTLLPRISSMSLREIKGLRNINPYLDSRALLKELEVYRCDKLEYLIDLKEEVKDVVEEEKGILANLTELHLSCLSNLEELWKGHIELVHLRNLKTVLIWNCPKLKVVFPFVDSSTNLVPFRCLKRVSIRNCSKLKVIFQWSVAQRLEQLQDLIVLDCEELEEIVGREEADHNVLFPTLQQLLIGRLPKLNGFYTGNLPGSQSTPKLKTVFIGGSLVNMAVDGRNLDEVIKENKGLLVQDYTGEEDEIKLTASFFSGLKRVSSVHKVPAYDRVRNLIKWASGSEI